jgi:hypothetical protein
VSFHQRGREWNDIENDERAHGWVYVNEDISLDYYDDDLDDVNPDEADPNFFGDAYNL